MVLTQYEILEMTKKIEKQDFRRVHRELGAFIDSSSEVYEKDSYVKL